MSWFSHIGAKALRYEVSIQIQTVRYKNLKDKSLFVVWQRNDKEEKTKPMPGKKGVYDFLDLDTSPSEPAAPLKFACTMYLKKDKFVPKKSKLYIRCNQGTSTLDLGWTEFIISDHLNPKTPGTPIQENITLEFKKSVDKQATVTFQFRARWDQTVDVAKLKEEDPDAVSRASGISAFVKENGDDHDEVDEPADEHQQGETDEDEEEAEARRKKKAADAKIIEKSQVKKPSATTTAAEEDGGEEDEVEEEYEEDEDEKAAKKAAKKARREERAKKKAAKAARRAQEEEEGEEEEVEEEEVVEEEVAPPPAAKPVAVAPTSNGPSASSSTASPPAAARGSIKSNTSALIPSSPVVQSQPVPVPEPVVEEEPEEDNPDWTNFTGTLPYIMSLQNEAEPELDIPLPVHKLIKAIKKLGGFETDAIFKVQPDPALVDALKARIEGGVYKLKTDDPHIPAATLKKWLASIAIPIFPPTVHALILRAGAMDDIDPAAERKKRAAQATEEDTDEDEEETKKPKSKQATLQADLYSDLLSGLESKEEPAAESGPTVRDLVAQVIAAIPDSHRHVLHAFVSMWSKMLEPKSRAKNHHKPESLTVIFGDLLTRLQNTKAKPQYEFFLDKSYVNKFLEYLIKYQDVLEEDFPDVPYPTLKSLLPQPIAPVAAAVPTIAVSTAPHDYSDILQPHAAPTQPPQPTATTPPGGPIHSQPEEHEEKIEPVEAAELEPEPTPAVVDEKAEEEEEVDEDAEERERKERKRLKKEKKEAKKAKRSKKPKEEEEEEVEEEEAEATPAPVAASADLGLLPLNGLTPQKSQPATRSSVSSPPDPFADIMLASTAGQPASSPAATSVPSTPQTTSPLQPPPSGPSHSLESFALVDDDEDDREREARLAQEAKLAKKKKKLEEEDAAVLEARKKQQALATAAAASVAAAPEKATSSKPVEIVSASSSPDLKPKATPAPPPAQPPAPVPAATLPSGGSNAAANVARIHELEHLLSERDAKIVSLESNLASLQKQHAEERKQQEELTIALQQDVQKWRDEAKAANKKAKEAEQLAIAAQSSHGAAVATSVTSPTGKNPDVVMEKLRKKLQNARDENDALLEQVEACTKQLGLLQTISDEKTKAMNILKQQVAQAGAGVGPTHIRSNSSSSAALTTKPVSSMSQIELSDLIDSIQTRILSDEAAAGLGDGKHLAPLNDAAEAEDSFVSDEVGPDSTRHSRSASNISSSDVANLALHVKRSARGRKISSSISSATGALAQKDQELRRLQAELHASQEALISAQASLDDQINRVDQLEIDLADERSSHQVDLERVKLDVDRLKTLEQAMEENGRRLLLAEESRAQARKESEAAHAKLHELETQLATELPALQKELTAQEVKYTKLHGKYTALQREQQSLQEQLEERKAKIKELIAANEQRVAATMATPTKRPITHDTDSSSEEDSNARSRRQRKISALSSPAAVGSADTLQYKQLLADKNHLIEDLEATERSLRAKIEAFERERAELVTRSEQAAATSAQELTKLQQKNAELTATLASTRRELEDLQKQHQKLLELPRPSPVSAASGKSSSLVTASSDATHIEQLQQHISAQEVTIQSYINHINVLKEQEASLQEKLKKLSSAPSTNSTSSSSSQDAVELKKQYDAALESHALKLSQVEADAATKITMLQKFKTALGEKYSQLESELAQLRARELKFNSLNDVIDKKYLDPKEKKKLDRKELTLLQALQEQQRRTQFLEEQLKQADSTLEVTKDTYHQTNLVLEQELEGLEQENENLKELYQEIKNQLQRALAGNTNESNMKYVVSAISVDWNKYESAQMRLTTAENLNAELTAQLSQLRESLDVTKAEIVTLKQRLHESQEEARLLKEDLVRTGITLKTIAADNFEMKEYIRENQTPKKK